MNLHYVQHVPFENPGSILVWAEKNHIKVTSTKLYLDEAFPAIESFDWLVVMGGPMNIYEEDQYPWLIREKDFIRKSIDQGKVLLGLCLGGQLIADVIGGKVVQNPQKEIGWFSVTFTDEALAMEEFSFFPKEALVFEWHGDTFVELPEEAKVIAGNTVCTNQAFVYAGKVYGFQFHLENTRQILYDLIQHCGEEMIVCDTVQTPEEILSNEEFIEIDQVWMDKLLDSLLRIHGGM